LFAEYCPSVRTQLIRLLLSKKSTQTMNTIVTIKYLFLMNFNNRSDLKRFNMGINFPEQI